MKIILRLACMNDAEILLAWRNDPDTRRFSRNTDIIPANHHVRWLSATILRPNIKFRIAECDGVPVGTIHSDRTMNGWELSWTVAPEMRRKGVGTCMAKEFAKSLNGVLTAEMRPENYASIRIAESLGMKLCGERNGLLCYGVMPKMA